jgi:gluconate 2-dehydrogenase gamma chain
VLAAAAETVLPGVFGAGAREAGVAGFVARALDESRHRAWRSLVEEGLDRLDAAAREATGRGFAACSGAERAGRLAALQRGTDARGRAFVDRLVLLCLEGFLCDPRHGGNRDGAGWRAMGVTAPDEDERTDACRPDGTR